MFTGIVTHLGTIGAVRELEDGRELEVESDLPLAELPPGASLAHSGVCLTVVGIAGRRHRVQASGETLRRTTLGDWRAGDLVNLERSLRIGDELGGHLVFGHVDAVGELLSVRREGEAHRLELALPPDLAPLFAVKGSVAVDGISLTVNAVRDDRFSVTIIPHSWAHTTLHRRRTGDRVNLEADMLARYVARQLSAAKAP